MWVYCPLSKQIVNLNDMSKENISKNPYDSEFLLLA